jgi:hypothetical protein
MMIPEKSSGRHTLYLPDADFRIIYEQQSNVL